jgi:hypothetical protein
MFRLPCSYLAATILFAAFNSMACGQAIDLVCSGTWHDFRPTPTINSTVGPAATKVDLENRRITTPIGNFSMFKIEDTKIWFQDDPGKQLFVQGSLDRLSGQMTISWWNPEEMWKRAAMIAELRCSAAKRLF